MTLKDNWADGNTIHASDINAIADAVNNTSDFITVSVQTSNYTATAGNLVPVNASSGNLTVTLPSSPIDGARVIVEKIDSSTHTVTVNCSGSDRFTVSNGNTSFVLSNPSQAVTFHYASASAIWYIISGTTSLTDNSDGTANSSSVKISTPLAGSSVITTATPPVIGEMNFYDATGGSISTTLPALSGLNVGARLAVQKVDSSANWVTFSSSGSDTFYENSSTINLKVPGEQQELQVISLSSVKYWAHTSNLAPLSSLDGRYISKATGTASNKTFLRGDGTWSSLGLISTGVQTSSLTATPGSFIPCNTSSGSIVITLPSAPAEGSQLCVKKTDSSANTVNLSASGTDKFNTSTGTTSIVLSLQNEVVATQYSSGIWYVLSDITSMGNLDSRYYQKPSTGIPATDLSSAAQSNLTAASTALQSVSSSSLTDATTVGKSLITAASQSAARLALGPQYFDVRDYGAVGDGSTDSTSAIQAALDAAAAAKGGVVFFPSGVFKISAALDLGSNTHHNVTIQGSGSGQTFSVGDGCTVIKQTSTTAHGITTGGTLWFALRDISILGPGSGSGIGVNLATSGAANFNQSMRNVVVRGFGGDGISLQTMCMSAFSNVTSTANGGNGFTIDKGGTSCSFESCWGAGNTLNGWNILQQDYSVWNACGADGNSNHGWYISNGSGGSPVGLTWNACGTEDNAVDGMHFQPAAGHYMFNHMVNGLVIAANHHYGVYVGGGSSSIVLNNVSETSGSGAVNGIRTESPAITTVTNQACQTTCSFAGYQDMQWISNPMSLMVGSGGSNHTYTFPSISGKLAVSSSGTASSTTFLRGDGAWVTPQSLVIGTTTGTAGDGGVLTTAAGLAATAYQKPGTGIPATDLASGVQAELTAAGTALQSVSSASLTDATTLGKSLVTASSQSVARLALGPQVYDVRDYGAVGDNTHDDTSAIQAAINAAGATHGGVVFLPPGTFKISAALTVGYQNIIIRGSGFGSEFGGQQTNSATTINQTSTSAHGIVTTSTPQGLGVEDIVIAGPGSGTGIGINWASPVWSSFNNHMDNVVVRDFGGDGIFLQVMCMSTFSNVTTARCGGHGFNITGRASTPPGTGGAGTSCTFDSCFASSNAGNGWHINSYGYSVWNACGADSNTGHGYCITNTLTIYLSGGLVFNGCGAEVNNGNGVDIGGTGSTYPITGVVINGMWVWNKGIGVHCGTMARQVTITNFTENSSTGATNSIKTEAGSTTRVMAWTGQSPASWGGTDTYEAAGTLTVPHLTVGGVQVGSSGTPSSTTFLRGDGAWATVAGGTVQTRVYDVRDYGAVGDGSHDDTSAIQAAIDATAGSSTPVGGVVFLPPGVYKITSALSLGTNTRHNVTIQGSGAGGTFTATDSVTVIKQTSTTANGITTGGTQWFSLRDIMVQGPGSGSGIGVNLASSGASNFNMSMSNVVVRDFGGDGIYLQTVCMSTFFNANSIGNGGNGFSVLGGGTTCTFNSCFASGNALNGWNIPWQGYSVWSACGADGNSQNGWKIVGPSSDLTLNACGSEGNTLNALDIGDWGSYLIGVTVNGFTAAKNKGIGVHVWGKAVQILLTSINESAAAGATNGIKTEASAVVRTFNYACQTTCSFAGYIETHENIQDGVFHVTRSGTDTALTWPSTSGTLAVSSSGTPNSSTFLRGDGAWAIPVKTVNAQTGTTYTLALTDGYVTLNNSSSVTVTIPPNSSVAFPVGASIDLVRLGAGTVTVSAGSGVTLNTALASSQIPSQYGKANLTQISANTWVLA